MRPRPKPSSHVLVLGANRPGGHVNDLIHRGFYDSHGVTWYGPGEVLNPRRESLARVLDRLRPMLVIVNMRKRVPWLKSDLIKSIKAPKACVEVDFCYEKDDKWYRRCGFDKVFFRSYLDAERATLPSAWLPFSVDPAWVAEPAVAKPFATYAGNTKDVHLYPVRTLARTVLREAGLLEEPPGYRLGIDYMRWWRKYAAGLTCGSKFDGANAKHFIIPAAGAALLTDNPPGTELLFPGGHYWTYRKDCSDLVEIVRSIVTHPDQHLARRARMQEEVVRLHTHAVRWAELLGHMGLATISAEGAHA